MNAAEIDYADNARGRVLLVHKGIRPLTAGDIRRLAENLDALDIPDESPAEIRTPITGDRHKVDIAFRRATTTTATTTEGNAHQS